MITISSSGILFIQLSDYTLLLLLLAFGLKKAKLRFFLISILPCLLCVIIGLYNNLIGLTLLMFYYVAFVKWKKMNILDSYIWAMCSYLVSYTGSALSSALLFTELLSPLISVSFSSERHMLISSVYLSIIFMALFYILLRTVLKKLCLFDSAREFKVLAACLLTLLNLMLFSYTFTLQYLEIQIEFLNVTIFLLIFQLIFFSGLFVLFFLYFRKQAQRSKSEYELKAMRTYNKELENYYAQMRAFKHDYQNLLLTLGKYIADGDMQALHDHYQKLFSFSKEELDRNVFCFKGLDRVLNKPIKSFLISKFIRFESFEQIEVSFECMDEVKEIYADELVVIRLLGIFLDNAIEAAAASGKPGSVKMAMIAEDQSFECMIVNSHSDAPLPFDQLSKKGYSTKGENRGLGLYTAASLISRQSNMLMQHSMSAEQFSVSLIVERR